MPDADTDKYRAVKDYRFEELEKAFKAFVVLMTRYMDDERARQREEEKEKSGWREQHASAVTECKHHGALAIEAKHNSQIALKRVTSLEDKLEATTRKANSMVRPVGSRRSEMLSIGTLVTVILEHIITYFQRNP